MKARTIADWFLRRASEEGEAVTQMKLQKLVYIAHGWHLAILGKPLIDESVQAWQWGPVVPSLYGDFKQYGSTPIVLPTRIDPVKLPKETEEILNKVWGVYKRFTAMELSSLTHREGTPWSKAFRPYAKLEIDDKEIMTHYRKMAAERHERSVTK